MTWKIRYVGFNLRLPPRGEGGRNTIRSTWLAARGTDMSTLTREGTGPHPEVNIQPARRRHDGRQQAICPGEKTEYTATAGTPHSRSDGAFAWTT